VTGLRDSSYNLSNERSRVREFLHGATRVWRFSGPLTGLFPLTVLGRTCLDALDEWASAVSSPVLPVEEREAHDVAVDPFIRQQLEQHGSSLSEPFLLSISFSRSEETVMSTCARQLQQNNQD
jgi:hypothetical protein